MKTKSITALGLSALVALVALAAFWTAGRVAEGAWPFGKSEPSPRPLPRRYLKIAPTADESKIVSVVFDASQGTTTQYDIAYAEMGTSVNLESAKRLDAKTRKSASQIVCAFPAFDLPRDQKESGTSTTASVNICHCKSGDNEVFCITARTAVTEDANRWQYSATGRVTPGQSADKNPVLRLCRQPDLAIETKPDLNKKGNLGIALSLKSGEGTLEFTKNGKPPDAHIAVKSADGKIVSQDTQPIDKFAFG